MCSVRTRAMYVYYTLVEMHTGPRLKVTGCTLNCTDWEVQEPTMSTRPMSSCFGGVDGGRQHEKMGGCGWALACLEERHSRQSNSGTILILDSSKQQQHHPSSLKEGTTERTAARVPQRKLPRGP